MDLKAPVRLHSDEAAVPQVLELLRAAFAYMDNRIDPPSSLHRMALHDIRMQCDTGEVWCIGTPPVACMFLTPKADVLYLSKLCVAQSHRGKGLARRLIAWAETRARNLGCSRVELQTRVELVENHLTFARLGFVETARTAHPGYDRPTSLTMSRAVPPT